MSIVDSQLSGKFLFKKDVLSWTKALMAGNAVDVMVNVKNDDKSTLVRAAIYAYEIIGAFRFSVTLMY